MSRTDVVQINLNGSESPNASKKTNNNEIQHSTYNDVVVQNIYTYIYICLYSILDRQYKQVQKENHNSHRSPHMFADLLYVRTRYVWATSKRNPQKKKTVQNNYIKRKETKKNCV